MARTFELKKEEFARAVDSLARALKKEKDEFLRDSVIKRFEYCYELAWKTVKVYLSEKYGRELFSPKEVFRELRVQGVLSEEDVEEALRMADNRNRVIHMYEEELSEEMYDKIKDKYSPLLKKLEERMDDG